MCSLKGRFGGNHFHKLQAYINLSSVSAALCHVQGGSCFRYKFKPSLILKLRLNCKKVEGHVLCPGFKTKALMRVGLII